MAGYTECPRCGVMYKGEHTCSTSTEAKLIPKLSEGISGLSDLIREKAHMVSILSQGIDVAYQLGRSMEVKNVEEALKLLHLALDAALITHKWDEAERWVEKLMERVKFHV